MLKSILPFLNLGLRAASLLSKFIIIIYLGKFFSTEDLGLYSLFNNTISLAIFFLGFEFYSYNTRELLANPIDKILPLIRDQFVFHVVAYIVILPLLGIIFIFDILPVRFFFWFYLILVVEHLSQEFYRLYIVLSKPIFANFLLFIRTGLWVYAVIMLWFFEFNDLKTLETLWIGWFIGGALSCVIAWLYLKKSNIGSVKGIPVNWPWIYTGIKIAFPFFVAALGRNVIEFIDRYMLDLWLGKSEVGVYSLFRSISNIVYIVAVNLVINIYHATLIGKYTSNGPDAFQEELKQFSKKLIFYSIASATFLVITIPFVLEYLQKQQFNESVITFYILLISNCILNISHIPSYILYVKRRDKTLMYATLAGAFVNILLNIIFIQTWGITGAALSTLLSYLFVSLITGYVAFNTAKK